MHRELLDALSVITEEEQRILDEQRGIDPQLYTEKKELIVDSEKLLKKGKLIQVRPHTRFVNFPKHKHNYVEVIYMCQGTTTHILNGSKVILEAGDLLFLNQNAEQEILPAGEQDIAVNFIVLPEFFDTAFSMMDMEEENALKEFLVGALCGKNDQTSYLYFHVAEILPIQNLVENMVWTLLNDQPNKRSINQITMGLLFLQLMNYTERVQVGEQYFEQEMLLGVYRYIEEHYREGSLSELAEELHYDFYTLSRMIRRLTGKNYTELVQNKRLTQAAYLLETTGLSVADIGERVGYENMSYFHRIFKERYGISPKKYRVEKKIQ